MIKSFYDDILCPGHLLAALAKLASRMLKRPSGLCLNGKEDTFSLKNISIDPLLVLYSRATMTFASVFISNSGISNIISG